MARSVNKVHVHHTPATDKNEFYSNKGRLQAAWRVPPVIVPKVIECWRVASSDNEAGFSAELTFTNEKG